MFFFFSPFSRAINSLGEERAYLIAFRTLSSICARMVLSVSSSSWCLGRTVACDSGTPWSFLLPLIFHFIITGASSSGNLSYASKKKR